MTEPKLATSSRRGRFYELPNGGPPLPSVTTILDVLAKPALVRWAAKEVADAAWSKRKVLAAASPTDYEDMVKMLKGSPWSKRGKAADLGTSVHEVAAALSLDEDLPDISKEAEPYVDAFLQAVKDLELDFEVVEATVGNRTIGYAGSLDSIATSGTLGKRLLIDIKSGKGVYPEMALQLSAYRRAEVIVKERPIPGGFDTDLGEGEQYGIDPDHPLGVESYEDPMPQVDGGAVLHVKPDGEYAWLPANTSEPTFAIFAALAQVWRWNDEDAKAALG